MSIAPRPARTPKAGLDGHGGGNGARRQSTRADRRGVVGEIADRRLADLRPVLEALGAASLRRKLADAPPVRPFAERLAAPGLHLVAEIKRGSPSAGRIAAEGRDIVALARAYQAGGAAAISVLCEPRWFGGSVEDLALVRSNVSVPVLAKEFVVDPRQLELLRAVGADAVLLLAVLQPRRSLGRLVQRRPLERSSPPELIPTIRSRRHERRS